MGRVGIEPTTLGLKGPCSAAELPARAKVAENGARQQPGTHVLRKVLHSLRQWIAPRRLKPEPEPEPEPVHSFPNATRRPILQSGTATNRTPMTDSSGDITRLVEQWSQGDGQAFDQLIELVYDDLRRIAHRQLRHDGPDRTIDTTSLVHEAYLKLARQPEGIWRSRAQFFAFASKAMRHILIDYARRRQAAKRGGTRIRVPLDENMGAVDDEVAELLALDEALALLAEHDQRMASVVECRFFGGLSVAETAEALGSSVRTVERDWTRARAYLHRTLAARHPPDPGDGSGTDDTSAAMDEPAD